MPGRVFIPYKFRTPPTNSELIDVDYEVNNNCNELMRSAYAATPLIYIGGTGNRSLSNVGERDVLHLTSHVYTNTSNFVVGKDETEVQYTAQQMAKILEDEGLSKNIRMIELFGCSAARSFGKKNEILELRVVLKQIAKLKKEKKKLKGEIENASFYTLVSLKERRIKAIDVSLEEKKRVHNAVYVRAQIALYDFQNITMNFDQYMLPLGAELCAELKSRGYRNVTVRAFIGQISITNGIKEIHYTENDTYVTHSTDGQNRGAPGIIRNWQSAYIDYN